MRDSGFFSSIFNVLDASGKRRFFGTGRKEGGRSNPAAYVHTHTHTYTHTHRYLANLSIRDLFKPLPHSGITASVIYVRERKSEREFVCCVRFIYEERRKKE